jgi:hypothetical protein
MGRCCRSSTQTKAVSSAAAPGQPPYDRRRAPAEAIAVDQRPDQQEKTGAEGEDAHHVEAFGCMVARLRDHDGSGDEQRDADGYVDEEGPPPAAQSGEHAAADRSSGDRDAQARAPEGVGLRPLRPGEGVIDHRERCRQQQARADTLEGTGQVQHDCRRRQTAEGGRDREDTQAEKRRPLASVPIGIGSCRKQQRRKGEDVGAHDPLDIRESGAERPRHRRQRHRHNVRIEHDQGRDQ